MIENKTIDQRNTDVKVIEFEGDIMISNAELPGIKYRDIYFSQVEKGEIGKPRKNHQEKTSDEINIDVVFRFHKHESIDSVIRQLLKCRDSLTSCL